MAAPANRNLDCDLSIIARAAENWTRRTAQRHEHLTMGASAGVAGVEPPERIVAHTQLLRTAALRETQARRVLGLGRGSPVTEERTIGDRDFLGIEFLEMARAVARFVGRAHVREQRGVTDGFGTGFMVSPRLLMTNNHFLSSREVARFRQLEFDSPSAARRDANVGRSSQAWAAPPARHRGYRRLMHPA